MQAILGTPPPGRYPRWGYLDRLDTNEHMTRAFAAALVLLVAATIALTIVRHMVPPAGDFGTAPHSSPIVPIHPMLVPMPPPPIVPPVRPHVVPTPPVVTSIVPVDDAVAERDFTWGTRVGPPAGTGPGAGGEAWDGENPGTIPAVEPMTLPQASLDFIVVEREPELVWMRKPAYPDLAREAGIEGTVLVRVLVGADGTTQQVQLLQSVLGLDETAVEAAKTAVFKPALQQGRPVAVWVVIPIEFDLHRRLD